MYNARLQFLEAQIRMLRTRVDTNRVVPSAEEKDELLRLGAQPIVTESLLRSTERWTTIAGNKPLAVAGRSIWEISVGRDMRIPTMTPA